MIDAFQSVQPLGPSSNIKKIVSMLLSPKRKLRFSKWLTWHDLESRTVQAGTVATKSTPLLFITFDSLAGNLSPESNRNGIVNYCGTAQ